MSLESCIGEERIDYFLENPPKQPKKEIADYIEQNNILVPRRFKNLKQALKHVNNSGEIIVRSEHPQEYAGVSGLLESYSINKEILEEGKQYCDKHGTIIDWDKIDGSGNVKWDIEKQIFGQLKTSSQINFEENIKKLTTNLAEYYCEMMGEDFEEFYKNITYSYWEKINGFNRSIVADSAISNRYHIFTTNKGKDFFHNYLIIDNGEIVLNSPSELTEEMKVNIPEVVDFYEKIRNLDKFDPQHCPIIEFQTYEKGNNYFLQYHKTRQMELSTFTLDRDLEENEFEAVYVRGATPPEGLILNVAMYYRDYTIMDKEDGSFDFHYNFNFSEIMGRRRIANFGKSSIRDLSMDSMDNHLSKSKLFKAQMYVSIPKEKIPEELWTSMFEKTKETNKPARIPIRVISDGRKAYVRFEK